MALDPKVKAIIEILLKDKGTRKAVQGMAKGKAGADRFTQSLKKTETQASKLGQTLTRFLGAAVLGRVVFGAVSDFAKFERQLNSLSRQFGAEHIPAVRAFLEELEASSGIVRQALMPNLNLLIGITGNVAAGMELMRVAAAAADQGFGNINQNTIALNMIMKGEASEAQRVFAVTVKDSAGQLRAAGDVLEDVIKKFLQSGEVQEDAQSSLDKATAKWNDFKITLGETVAGPLSTAVAIFAFLLNTVRSIGPALNVVVGKIQGLSRGIGEAFEVLTDPSQFGRGFGEAISNAFARGFEGGQQRARDAIERLKGIWNDPELPKDAAQSAEEIAKAVQEAIDAANARWQKQKEDEELKAAQEKAEKRAELERKIQDELLAEQIAATEEGSEERLRLELEALERTRKMALEEAERLGADVETINRRFDLARERAIRESMDHRLEMAKETSRNIGEEFRQIADAETQAFQQLLDAQIELQAEGSRQRLELELARLVEQREQALEQENLTAEARAAIQETFRLRMLRKEKDFADAEKRIAFETALAKSDASQRMASAAIGAGMALFGQNKALMVASALIDTWAAANRALAEGGPFAGPALAALMIAQGLANVARIRSIQPGGGGGGGGRGGGGGLGRGSRAGRIASRQEFAGLSGKARPGGASGAVTNIDSRSSNVTNITLQGPVLLDRQGERRLARIVERAQRRDRARKIR